MQVGRVVAVVAVIGAVVSGCGSGPSQVGSAAIVGSQVVSLSTVQDQIAVALSPEKAPALAGLAQGRGAAGYGPQDAARQIVTSEVLSGLLRQRAAQEGIVVSDEAVDAALSAYGSTPQEQNQVSIYTPELQREKLRDDLTAAELGARYVDRYGISLRFTEVPTQAEAEAAARAVLAGGPDADAVFAAAPAAGRLREVLAADNPSLASSFAFGSPAGSVIVLRAPQEGANWAVVNIVDRRTDLPPSGPSAVERIGQQNLQLIGYRLLQQAADDAGVLINPRYGVWDPIQLAVVADDQTAGTILAPPSPE